MISKWYVIAENDSGVAQVVGAEMAESEARSVAKSMILNNYQEVCIAQMTVKFFRSVSSDEPRAGEP